MCDGGRVGGDYGDSDEDDDKEKIEAAARWGSGNKGRRGEPSRSPIQEARRMRVK